MVSRKGIKILFFVITFGFFNSNVMGQISFKSVNSKLQIPKGSSKLMCKSPTLTIEFPLKRKVTILPQENLVTVSNQTIQIMILQFDGYNKATSGANLNNQKKLLEIYSKYELDYFENEIGAKIIDPSSQWVISKSKGWFIWYFNVGEVSTPETQLFATTIIDNKILIINAPMVAIRDSAKAALIINDMMEALKILPK